MSEYHSPWFLFNRHIETIYPALLRKVNDVVYERKRLITPDDDFLDLDYVRTGSKKAVIISHGLEGNTQRAYIKGMAKAFTKIGYDALTWNYRGCSEEINRQLRFYHSGATDDLDLIVRNATLQYNELFLIGFSLGGNLTLKYVGEKGDHLHPKVKKAVAFSVPIDLYSSCLQISQPGNWIYTKRFLKSLEAKVIAKSKIMAGINPTYLQHIKTLMDFDEYYTAPLHGFASALDYYNKCSSKQFLETIKIPALLVNAQNDPFLSKECFVQNTANPLLTFEMPKHGGHVGFSLFNKSGLYWSELRAINFIHG
jgi:predicted alpha/beta-fold hydrolase